MHAERFDGRVFLANDGLALRRPHRAPTTPTLPAFYYGGTNLLQLGVSIAQCRLLMPHAAGREQQLRARVQLLATAATVMAEFDGSGDFLDTNRFVAF